MLSKVRILLIALVLGWGAFAWSAHARDFFNCPIYPLPPEPPPLKQQPTDKPPPHQKTHEETFKETKGSGYNGDSSVPRAVLKWQAYVDEAQRAAKEKDRPFAIYFCDANTSRVAGEGREAWDKFRKQNGSAPPPTIFDSIVMLRAFEAAGVLEFVKVPDTADNQPLYKKYEATRNMLVFCAPDGGRLAVFPSQNLTQTNVVYFLEKGLAPYMTEWRKAVKADEERAAAEQKAKDERASRVAAIRARQSDDSTPKARPGDDAVAEALPQIEQRLANLDACAKAGWKVLQDKDKKGVHPIKEAGALYGLISALGEADGISEQSPAFLEGLYETQTRATALLAALKTWAKAGAPAEGIEKVNSEHKRLIAARAKIQKRK